LDTGDPIEEGGSEVAIRNRGIDQQSRSQNIVRLYVCLLILLNWKEVVQIIVVFRAGWGGDALESGEVELFFALDALEPIEEGRVRRAVLVCLAFIAIQKLDPLL
jgi:hypothetical protein